MTSITPANKIMDEVISELQPDLKEMDEDARKKFLILLKATKELVDKTLEQKFKKNIISKEMVGTSATATTIIMCKAITSAGTPCKTKAKDGQKYCGRHRFYNQN